MGEKMIESGTSKLVPVENSQWRKSFYFFTIVTALFFVGEVILLEQARQAALRMDSMWLTIHIANSLLPLLLGTVMTSAVTGMIIVFACTHPRQDPKDYGASVGLSVSVFMYIALIWTNRMLLEATLDYSSSPPLYPLSVVFMEIPLNMSMSLGFLLFLGLIVAMAWYKWLWRLGSL
jgi:hypothetical protein